MRNGCNCYEIHQAYKQMEKTSAVSAIDVLFYYSRWLAFHSCTVSINSFSAWYSYYNYCLRLDNQLGNAYLSGVVHLLYSMLTLVEAGSFFWVDGFFPPQMDGRQKKKQQLSFRCCCCFCWNGPPIKLCWKEKIMTTVGAVAVLLAYGQDSQASRQTIRILNGLLLFLFKACNSIYFHLRERK